MKIKTIYNTFYLLLLSMYNNSLLYQQLLKEHTVEEVDAIFQEELQKRNVSDYNEFIMNYNREYTEETIVKYVDLVSFFQLDIQDAFSKYLLNKYILNGQYLDKICNYHCIQYVIEELFKNYRLYDIEVWKKFRIGDRELLYISSYIDIIELNLEDNTLITDKGLKNCIHLQILNINETIHITSCEPFATYLTKLYANSFSFTNGMTDKGLKNCKNLKILDASNNFQITTCYSFKDSLIELWASSVCGIGDEGIKNCINLQILATYNNDKITTCEPFSNSLIELNASYQLSGIGDKGLLNCCNLQKLNAEGNPNITTCEPFCKSLIELNAVGSCGISDEGIKNCTKLRILISYYNSKITIKIENKDNL